MPTGCHPQEAQGEEISERAKDQHGVSRDGPHSLCQALLEHSKQEAVN